MSFWEKLEQLASNWANLITLITAVLTAIIICQTNRISRTQKKFEEKSQLTQHEFEDKINMQQMDIQKRQIQVDTFPYKREIYASVFAVLELSHELSQISKVTDLKTKTASQLRDMFDILLDQYIPDKKQILWLMREAEYILPENISASILDIRKHFDSMCAHFYTPSTFAKLGIAPGKELTKIIQLNVKGALDDCNRILEHVSFIEAALPKELNIANLNK